MFGCAYISTYAYDNFKYNMILSAVLLKADFKTNRFSDVCFFYITLFLLVYNQE